MDLNAFCIKNVFYTYGSLASKITAISGTINNDFAGEFRIGIIVTDDIETYAAILAVLLSGKTYIPIHWEYPAERIEQIIYQSGIKCILATNGRSDLSVAVTETASLVSHGQTSITIPAADLSKRDAYILFTSGSTGVPKGVPISYYNLDSFVDAFFALGYQLDERDRCLQMFDLTFDLSVMSYLIPLCLGACVYTVPEGGMKYTSIYNILESQEITIALMVPSILSFLRPYFGEIQLPHLRYSLFCGEALYKDMAMEWMQCTPNAAVDNVYGPTEATIFCMAYKMSREQDIEEYNGIVTIGQPMQGMEVIVVDDKLQPAKDGEKGELCLYGKQLTAGYLDDERNKEAFFELNNKKYYRTGDIVYKDEAGNFMYCGRADHQVKIQGFRVELSEVEFHLRKIVSNSNVVALNIVSVNGINQIDAVFEGAMFDTADVMEQLKTKLPAYMMPSRAHFVTTFPLNANGKIDRKELRKIIAAIA
jgi:D-alanine--poly(phosphoribitol) ligase subunit 1